MSRGHAAMRTANIYRQRLIDKFMRENSPCNNCPKRRQGCHSNCEAGEKFKAAFENFKATLLPEIIASTRHPNK